MNPGQNKSQLAKLVGLTQLRPKRYAAIIFVVLFAAFGVLVIFKSRAATQSLNLQPESGNITGPVQKVAGDTSASGGSYIKFGAIDEASQTKLRLFAPGWRPMAVGLTSAKAKATVFKEIIDGTYFDPVDSKAKAINPDDLHAAGARVYNYTLGPYVTNPYVPCDLIPTTHPFYNNYVVTTPSCLSPTHIPSDLSDLINTGKLSYSDWRTAIGQAKYGDPNSPKADKCPSDPAGPVILQSVYACRFENNFLIYPNSQPWITYLTEKLIPNALKFGGVVKYDGVFADSVGGNPAETPASYLSHLAQQPSSNNTSPTLSDPAYTTDAWLSASAASLTARRTKLDESGKSLVFNGLERGRDYWSGCTNIATIIDGTCLVDGSSNKKLIVAGTHGAMSEVVIRGAGDAINSWGNAQYATYWRKDIEMIRDVQRRNIKGYWWVKCWTGDDYSCLDEAPELVDQWRRFALSSYLVAAGNKSYFNWDVKRDDNNSAEEYPDYAHAQAVGYALGDYAEPKPNVLVRNYSNGIVLVNGTTSDVPVVVPDAVYKNFTDATGTPMSNITLPAHTGMVLIKQ